MNRIWAAIAAIFGPARRQDPPFTYLDKIAAPDAGEEPVIFVSLADLRRARP
jgi:hypothetical protein